MLCVATFLIFSNLGRDFLWEDEGDTAVLARSILQFGLPTAWDGVTFTDPDYGQREAFGFVMVSHPWLQYYAAAASFALFGDSPWAARLPFALAGLLTILVVYAMLISLLRNRAAAVAAAVLLTANVQFLLFARQARNYSLNALLTCLLIWLFLRLRSRRDAVLITLVAILSFHAHAIGLASLGALACLTLANRRFAAQRRWVWIAVAVVALYALPWLVLSQGGFEWNTNRLETLGAFPRRLLQFVVECVSVAPIVGLGWLCLAHLVLRRSPAATDEERMLAWSCLAVMSAQAVAMALTHSRDAIWIVGLHHTPAIIPLTMILVAFAVVRVSGSSRAVLVTLVAVLACTRLGQIAPWTFWAEPAAARDPSRLVTFHVPQVLRDRIFKTTPIHFVRSLVRSNPGVIERVSNFLEANAAAGDVVITNYEWEALYYHTRLPQGAKIAASFPVYAVARERRLPAYVFGHDRVRWIVWRRAWPAFFADQDCSDILRRISASGLVPRLAAAVPETMFENRENVHFRRFPDNRYVFPWDEDVPSALVYRVETYSEAVESYRRHPPEDLEGLTNYGVALIATGRREDALAPFRRAVEIAPDSAMSQRNLANLLLDIGDVPGAAPHAAQAVANAPEDPAANDALGRVLALQGEMVAAARHFQHALGIDPTFVDAREHLAQIDAWLSPRERIR